MDADQVVHVPIDSLAEWPGNPRKGDLSRIRESIQANGLYKPLLVQKGTRRIIAGNHTWRAARDLGHETVAVIFKDVNDDQARRILVVDNRVSDIAGYDMELLRTVLGDMDGYYGTGYSAAEMEELLGGPEPEPELFFDDEADGESEDVYVLDEVPATGADWAELPQQEAARAERQASQVVSSVKGTREIMLVYLADEHAEMISLLDDLRAAWDGDWRYPQIIQRLVREAAAGV